MTGTRGDWGQVFRCLAHNPQTWVDTGASGGRASHTHPMDMGPACLSYLAGFQLAPTRYSFEISEVHIQFWDWGVDKSLKYGAGQGPDHDSGTF